MSVHCSRQQDHSDVTPSNLFVFPSWVRSGKDKKEKSQWFILQKWFLLNVYFP